MTCSGLLIRWGLLVLQIRMCDNPLIDERRLAALGESCLLNQPGDPAFDRVSELAARLLNVPVALVSLVDAGHQYFAGEVGLVEPYATTRRTPLSHSFCQHVVARDEPLIIKDSREDDLVRRNLAVRDLNVIAYCGVPLRTGEGLVLGSLCAIDGKPRDWTAEDVKTLDQLAAAAMNEIELRRRVARLEREKLNFAEQHKDAAAAVAERESFMATLGHELRNSMSPAALAVQLLELDDRLPEDLRDDVATIRRSIGAENRLVQDLLDSARARSGRLNLDRKPQSVVRIVTDAVEDLDSDARSAGLSLNFECDVDCPEADVDGDRLRQLVSNLIGNAIKFTPDGGRIDVFVGRGPLGVYLSVTDTGPGIDQGLLANIFDPFVQAGTTASKKLGLGLGLAICRGIAEAHGGTIRASSRGHGHGASFRVDLPAAT